MTADQEDWRPLSQRETPHSEATLFEGVPDHLHAPLRDWIMRYLTLTQRSGNVSLARRVALRLRIPIKLTALAVSTSKELLDEADAHGQLLDVADAALHLDDALRWEVDVVGQEPSPEAEVADWVPPLKWPERSSYAIEAERLDQLLADAGSAYRVSWRRRCLVRRVDPTVHAAAESAMVDDTEAGGHLRAAWNAIYGLHPDPAKGYDEAVRAVEAAAIPVVLPGRPLETLGKVRAHLEDASSRWELAIEGKNRGAIGPLVAMIRLLWEGHARHAGTPSARPQRLDEATMAVHLAATLVHWFTSGAVRQRSSVATPLEGPPGN